MNERLLTAGGEVDALVEAVAARLADREAARRLAVSPEHAARLLSMSRDHFDVHVRDELRLVRVGRKVLVPISELERWLEQRASRPLVDELSS